MVAGGGNICGSTICALMKDKNLAWYGIFRAIKYSSETIQICVLAVTEVVRKLSQ